MKSSIAGATRAKEGLIAAEEARAINPAQPAAVSYSLAEALGDPTDEYPGQSSGALLAPFLSPEIEPEEFETVYLWFLS